MASISHKVNASSLDCSEFKILSVKLPSSESPDFPVIFWSTFAHLFTVSLAFLLCLVEDICSPELLVADCFSCSVSCNFWIAPPKMDISSAPHKSTRNPGVNASMLRIGNAPIDGFNDEKILSM
uniref:Uncharacterized protein n=1 Tax=Arundo donax TaxID=35708 RepID=A0A0A9DQJ2_ARUDO